MGKIPIVGLAIATSELATTDLTEHSHQPGPDFIFPKWHYNEAEDTVIHHSCMKMFKRRRRARLPLKQILLL